MSGTGEKHQLSQIMRNLHEMLRVLGENSQSNFSIKIDEFQYLRRDFIEAAQIFEKSTSELSYASDKKQRGILIYQISSNREVMDQTLKQMTNLVMRMKDKTGKNTSKNKLNKQGEPSKIQSQLQYKSLTIYNLEKHYFRLVKRQPKDASRQNRNKHYPDPETLQQLLKKRPSHRGFTQRSNQEDSEYLEEQEILHAIKDIDDRIQEKMDYILSGLQMINHNALAIRDGIDEVQRKILINVEMLDKNMEELKNAEDLLEEATPNASKPNCIMNTVIVLLLAVLAYLIISQLIPQTQDNHDGIK